MKGLFLRSIEKKEKIVIIYMDQYERVTQRYVRVIRMDEHTIMAYCYWRKKIRMFTKQNILSAGPIQKKLGA
ncbi:hypothetical protein [Ornithinibacillus contaminans]|uniref:hypothetical protein n=1 Tax=Ornithinibacillus contaminans TaxID=694055 RepID=UPI00064DCCF3|nr:hypothetical protein [Ornithinibacillus contaminans]